MKKIKLSKPQTFKRLIIIGALIIGIIIYSVKVRGGAVNNGLTGLLLPNEEEQTEQLKQEASDIEGMSRYDKLQAGLNPEDASDTDHDGLTDREEIEIYGSNPLSASTAGDLYMDGYKAQNGMDMNTYYEYEGEIVFSGNECANVTLEADDPLDMAASIQDYTYFYSLKDYGIEDVYAAYSVYGYDGAVHIDTAELLRTYDLDIEDVYTYIIEGDFVVSGSSKLISLKPEVSGTTLTVNHENPNRNNYFIFLTGKKGLVFGATLKSQEQGSNEAIICFSPILGSYRTLNIDFVSNDENADRQMKRNIIDYLIDYGKCVPEKLGLSVDNATYFNNVSKTTYNAKKSFLRTIFPACEWNYGETLTLKNWSYIFFVYAIYDNNEAFGSEYINNMLMETVDKSVSGKNEDYFNKYYDEFPFENFGTDFCLTGSCVGISYYTSLLYNTDTAPTQGQYDCELDGTIQNITWDITTDDENNTLSDPGIYDYKKSNFVHKHSSSSSNYLYKNLSAGEIEFVKMIGCYNTQGNEYILENMETKYNGEEYDFSIIQSMIDYIDQGKIINVALNFTDNSGHCVTVYDYYIADTGNIIFKVYDSNLPQDREMTGSSLNGDYCWLQVKPHTQPDGSKTFAFLYSPIKGDANYVATSNRSFAGVSSVFTVFDENWNFYK